MMEQLATRCPHCHTGFRVTQAQLELRGGRVRCGVCQHSFDAIAQRFDSADASAPAAASAAPAESLPQSSHASRTPADPISVVELAPSGKAAATTDGASMQSELDALSQAIDDLRARPWSEPPSTFPDGGSDALASDDHDSRLADAEPLPAYDTDLPEPAFIQTARRRSRGRRVRTVLLWIGIPLLTLALAAQLVYYFRNDIAAHSPQAARHLRELCGQLGCTIRLPMHLDQLSLDASQLDASPTLTPAPVAASDGQENLTANVATAQRLTLVALLRNRGNTAQAWPSIDLQLKGADGKVFVRKSFLPAQYLRADEITAGMSARSETEIRISFELVGEAPTGFDATLFYH